LTPVGLSPKKLVWTTRPRRPLLAAMSQPTTTKTVTPVSLLVDAVLVAAFLSAQKGLVLVLNVF
jgi:hypothetical protein